MITKDIIKNYFFLNPSEKLRVRQIERKTKTALPSVIRYVDELEKENILKKETIAGIVLYSADRSSQKFLLQKKLFNITSLFDSGMVDYLTKIFHNSPIVVFGSYSKGEDLENSDVDIFIESPSKDSFDLSGFEKKIHRKVQIFRYKNIRDIKNKNLVNNMINGIVINGFLEVL